MNNRHFAFGLTFALLVLASTAFAQIDLGGGGISVGGSLDVSASLTLSASGNYEALVLAAGSTLNIGSGAQVSCGTAQLNGGVVAQASDSSVTVTGPCNVAATNTFTSGTFSCNTAAAVASNGQLNFNAVALAPAVVQLSSGASTALSGCTVAQASQVSGDSSSDVVVQGGTTVCNANLNLASPCHVVSGGELQATDNGQVQIADNMELTLSSGTLSCSGAGAAGSTANIVVGTTSGATLACRNSAESTHAGGVVQLNGNSQFIVEQGSTHAVTAPVVFTGTGHSTCHGTISARSASCTYEHNDHHFGPGASCETRGSGQHIFVAGHQPFCHSCSHDQVSVSGVTHVIGSDTGAATSYEHVADSASSGPCQINGGAAFKIAANAQMHVASGARTVCQNGASSFQGGGKIVVHGAYECADVVTHNHAETHIEAGAHAIVSGSGQYVCGAGHKLIVHSGVNCDHVGVSGQTHVIAGSIEHVSDSASAGPSYVNAGANYALQATGKIHVNQGATCAYKGATQTTGAGEVLVEGTLQHEADYASNCKHTIAAGATHVINAANACSYGSLSYDSAAQTVIKAGSNGYTATQVSGAGQFAGQLHLQSNGYAPPQEVVLHNCGSAAGGFTAVTHDSATVKGQVQVTANQVVWHPYATGPCVAPSCCAVN